MICFAVGMVLLISAAYVLAFSLGHRMGRRSGIREGFDAGIRIEQEFSARFIQTLCNSDVGQLSPNECAFMRHRIEQIRSTDWN